MEYRTIELSFKQRITVGRESKFDSLEVYVGGEVALEPGEPAEAALVDLAVTLKKHLEKEFEMAAQQPSKGTEAFTHAKEQAMAPPPAPAPQPQQFTAKPRSYTCIEPNCNQMVQQANRRCWPHYAAWKNTRGG